MESYWRDEKHGLSIYHGDCLEVMPALAAGCRTVYTDPVWPNALPELTGAEDPLRLFAAMCERLPLSVARLVVHLGADSDPRFLAGVPTRLGFFRAVTLEYARPSYKGRVLYTFDVAYYFGEPPRSRRGYHVVPGHVWHTDAKASKFRDTHPCERRPQHVAWMLDRFSEPTDTILDPFAGAGTTLVSAWRTERRAVGIEISEEYCELAARRLEQEIAQGRLFEPAEVAVPGQGVLL